MHSVFIGIFSKTTLKTWDGKGIPHEANSNLASTTTMSPITSSPRIVTRPRTLDAQIYRDTQSSGLASRVVKYFENSEKKLRPIANRAYSRPGDLPIVNLDKNEITLSPRQSNGPKVAKINIGPPLRLNNQVSARSAIFRTGKNYGDNLPFTREGHSNTQSTTTLSRNVTHDNEPIASTSQEYDTNPTRSVLDALKEISRKRIHCDVSKNTLCGPDYILMLCHTFSGIRRRFHEKTSNRTSTQCYSPGT